ncbi:hypothetical protein KEM52_005347 [Ascosphaera acerosa]|nr:hypothetical protein KEM52_005347 [Ascosphaera acerosa]
MSTEKDNHGLAMRQPPTKAPPYKPYLQKAMDEMHEFNFARENQAESRRSVTRTQHLPNAWNGLLVTPDELTAAVVWANQTNYGGIAIAMGESELVFAFGVRDATYFLDFTLRRYPLADGPNAIEDAIMALVMAYEVDHAEKFLGLCIPGALVEKLPQLCSRLWNDLDIVPLVIDGHDGVHNAWWDEQQGLANKTIDELADSMSRRCISFFNPEKEPYLQVGFRGDVDVDCGSHAVIATLKDYEESVGAPTWRALLKYADKARKQKLKVAFFSATPQGGGVALMRHALVRLSRLLHVDVKWYVPRPSPEVFRITKTNHNILQGVAAPNERLTQDGMRALEEWAHRNAERYWTTEGGALQPPEKGGADVVVIDDPQMPSLIPLIKKMTPDRPVIYRSHIQIRSDLIDVPDSPQHEVWEFLWKSIKLADVFLSHPVDVFVPNNVPKEKVGFLPATTDWLDGLNKYMDERITSYYGNVFNSHCKALSMVTIDYPEDSYIIQVARFDPSKGIFHVLDSYSRLLELLQQRAPHVTPPKLLICGHGSIDDPDGAIVYNQVLDALDGPLRHLKQNVCAMRVPSSDQILNALMSKAKIALQLSTREGFEIKVSEALHHGKPVIASLAGGIPLQVTDGHNGFLVKVGDNATVAERLYQLWTDEELYARMSKAAATSVSDELSTAGNLMSWLYLATEMSERELRPDGAWINDMAREAAGEPYKEGESKVPRDIHMGYVKTIDE